MTGPIGRLRHRLVLERLERTPDGGVGATHAWVEEAAVWAEIKPLGGGEAVLADRISGSVSHEITIRYRAGLTPDMRLRQGARVFAIDAVLDVEERRSFLRVLCTEEEL